MTTDFRALCAELLLALESEGYAHWTVPPHEDDLCLRARAALVEPEQEGPTDKELFDVAEVYAEDNGLIGLHNASDFARAVLARWGT